MDSGTEVVHDFHPLFRIFKDGRVERFRGTDTVPPSDDPLTDVRSKDVVISPKTGVSARLFIPKSANPTPKLPLLIYIHGGAFSIESAFSSLYHNHLNSLVVEANVIAVSVNYKLAPEYPIPTCYDDSWAATQWVASHCDGRGPEPWLNDHADFGRIFLAGDSAGANIAHNVAVRAGTDGLRDGVKLVGLALVQPFFGNDERDELWTFICPDTAGCGDLRLNPAADSRVLSSLGCIKVLVCVAEKDHLRERGWTYYEALRKSGWEGAVEIVETEGVEHVFHLFNPSCEKAVALLKRLASFVNQS